MAAVAFFALVLAAATAVASSRDAGEGVVLPTELPLPVEITTVPRATTPPDDITLQPSSWHGSFDNPGSASDVGASFLSAPMSAISASPEAIASSWSLAPEGADAASATAEGPVTRTSAVVARLSGH